MYDAIIVYSELEEMIQEVEGIRKRDVDYVLALTINNLAFDAMKSVEKQMGSNLKITKKQMLSAFGVKKATKSSKVAELFVDEGKWQYKALQHHFNAGDRFRKGLESMLRYKGLMTQGEILTPSPNTKLKRSAYKRISEQIKTGKRTVSAKGRVSRERYFFVPSRSHSHLSAGIYAQMPNVPFPVSILRIASKPNYRKRFDLLEIVEKVSTRRANIHLGKALDKVLAQNHHRGWK